MKKAVSFLLAVLMLVSVFAVAVFATPTKPSVLTELAGLRVDGKQFNESDYPIDKSRDDIEVLSVAEKSFRTLTSSPDYGLYIYVYNPSCVVFDVNKSNSIQIGLNLDSNDYSFYGLELMSRSDDHRFYKYRVVSYGSNIVSDLYKLQESVSERVYNIPTIRLSSGNVLTSYPVKNVYIFSGYDANNSLTCSVRDCEVIEVELHDTTWVSPNAGSTISGKEVDMYDHYEIHSVYFAIDREYLNKYDYLSSIRASYEARKLTPIVVTRSGNLSAATVSSIQNGKHVSGGIDIDDLAAIRKFSLFLQVDWWYSETDIDFGNYKADNRYDQLVYYFKNDKLPEDFDMNGVNSMLGFTSDELRERYYELVNKGYHSNLLYSESSGVQEIDYRAGEMFNLKTYTQDMGKFAKWWHDLTTKKDSYLNDSFVTDVKKIEVIDNPSFYANISDNSFKQYGDELYINECDMAAFKTFCNKAALEDKVVVMLRYAVADYRCVPVYDVMEFTGSLWGTEDPVAMSIEKSAYFNVSVAQIGFTTAGVETIIPTVSNTVDSFGDGIVSEDPRDKNGILPGDGDSPNFDWEELLSKLKVAGFVFLIVVVIVVLIWFIPKLFGIFEAVSTARRLKKMEKQSEKQTNKKE